MPRLAMAGWGGSRRVPWKASLALVSGPSALDFRHSEGMFRQRPGFDEAWQLTMGPVASTHHTLMPEALESGPPPLFTHLLPRHRQIIYPINARVLCDVRKAVRGDGAAAAMKAALKNAVTTDFLQGASGADYAALYTQLIEEQA